MKQLFFQVEPIPAKPYRYTVLEYKIINGFYEFTDTTNGKFYRWKESIFVGEAEVKEQ